MIITRNAEHKEEIIPVDIKSVKQMTLPNSPENVRPSLQLLSQDQMNDIHQYSVRILEDTGIRVESKRALEIFRKSDAVRIENDLVHI